MTSNFVLIGAAGYIAPRHFKAIKENNCNLLAAYDVNDSVGVIDSYYPNAQFFTEFEKFSSYVHKEQAKGNHVDFVSICSPNHLHKSHIDFALRNGSTAICEKPLVLHPDELDDLQELIEETNGRICTVLQLRLHPAIIALRDKVKSSPSEKIYDVDLGYFTSRGPWYHASWKNEVKKSGGIVFNIGIHFFDMLSFVFGPIKSCVVHHRDDVLAAGYLEFEQARVRWILSINRDHLPPEAGGNNFYRSMTVDGEDIEFSGNFTDLHTTTYQHVLEDEGYGLDDVRPSIELASEISAATLEDSTETQHPYLSEILRI